MSSGSKKEHEVVPLSSTDAHGDNGKSSKDKEKHKEKEKDKDKEKSSSPRKGSKSDKSEKTPSSTKKRQSVSPEAIETPHPPTDGKPRTRSENATEGKTATAHDANKTSTASTAKRAGEEPANGKTDGATTNTGSSPTPRQDEQQQQRQQSNGTSGRKTDDEKTPKESSSSRKGNHESNRPGGKKVNPLTPSAATATAAPTTSGKPYTNSNNNNNNVATTPTQEDSTGAESSNGRRGIHSSLSTTNSSLLINKSAALGTSNGAVAENNNNNSMNAKGSPNQGMKASIRAPSPTSPSGGSGAYARSAGAMGAMRNVSSSNVSVRSNEEENLAATLAEHGIHLSNRALYVVQRVNEVIHRCQARNPKQLPTDEELAMYDVFVNLRNSPIGPLFVNHPEVSLSNRSCVITTPDFHQDEFIDGYKLRGAYNPGTIGRSYFAVKETNESSEVSATGASSTSNADRLSRSRARNTDDPDANHCILKAVSFVLRKSVLDAVIADQRCLVHFSYANVLEIIDVLNDEYKENMIVISRYHPNSNISAYAGNLDDDPEKLRRIIHEVAVGLRVIHSQKIYHHNVKLDNVLETKSGHYCLADSGFSRLFTSQCPESLVFNGELACLAPEVFDPNGRYANVETDESISGGSTRRSSVGVGFNVPRGASSNASQTSKDNFGGNNSTISGTNPVALVDIWGFGVLMYRLAYGKDPIEIAECNFSEVSHRIRTHEVQFPKKNWPFAAALEDAIRWCLEKDPAKRPNIMRLLRHDFFKDSLAQSFSAPRAALSSVKELALGTSIATMQHMQTGLSAKAIRSVQNYGYVVDTRIGNGSRTNTLLVHLKRDPSQSFAFKFVQSVMKRIENVADDDATKEIIRELATSKKFEHPNVVKYIDIVDGKREGTSFVVQEYFADGSLRAMPPVKASSKSSKPEVTLQLLLTDVLCGLIFLHDNKVTHLSVRPSNIFFDKASGHYKLTDYGPSFLTIEDIVSAQQSGKPIYSLPQWLTEDPKSVNGYHLDLFTLGLLAASVVPDVFETCWQQYTKENDSSLDVDAVIRKVEEYPKKLSSKLVSLIRTLLTTPTTARELIKHSYFKSFFKEHPVGTTIVDVNELDLKNAVQRRPETHDETRLLDILGVDPLQDTTNSLGDNSCEDGREKSGLSVSFVGKNPECGMCGAEMIIALYRCPVCPNYLRCGKCALNDQHKPGHVLAPLIIYTIQHAKDEHCRAALIPPTTIGDAHALETLEMKANLPAGSLMNHLANQRAMERSMARSGMIPVSALMSMGGGGGGGGGPGGGVSSPAFGNLLASHNPVSFRQFGGTELQSVMESESSISTIHVNKNLSMKSGMNGHAGNTGLAGVGPDESSAAVSGVDPESSLATSSTTGGPLLKSSKHNMLGATPFPPAKNTLLKQAGMTAARKLPKAEDLDDGTWQQELDNCRDKELTDLLLYNYEFTEIPKEVYSPPPLHVTYLDLSHNDITDIPHELSLMVHLQKLVLSYNKLTELPDSLGNLSELESLDISHNAVDDLPLSFIYLSNLESLAMDYNSFSCVPECVLDIKPPAEVDSFCSVPSSSGVMRNNGSFGNSSAAGVIGVAAVEAPAERSPRLNALFMAANDRLTVFPDVTRLQRFDSLKLAFDNEPTLYKYFLDQNLETKLPNVTFNWNKIYPDEIVPFLYCGSLRSAQSQMVYEKLKISYVLTVGRGLMPLPPEGGKHKIIVVDDIPGADILSSFQEAINFIDESQRRGSGCLVHCFAGLSRSATTVVAYLMVKKKMRLDDAYALVKKGRPAILPNKGFFEQLLKLDHQMMPNETKPLNREAFGRTDVDDLLDADDAERKKKADAETK